MSDLTDELATASRGVLEGLTTTGDHRDGLRWTVWAKRVKRLRATLNRYEAARSRGESEMTGTAFLDGDNFCEEGDQPSWTFVPSCPHQPDSTDSETRPARLVIYPPPETDR